MPLLSNIAKAIVKEGAESNQELHVLYEDEFEELHSESPCERDNGPDDSTRLMTDLDRT
jgi:hypothetical protein